MGTRKPTPAVLAGDPVRPDDPTEFRGHNDRGAVRPADDRFLEDAKLDERDAYLLEVTGPDAQQLVHKRETLRAAIDRLDDDALGAVIAGLPEGIDLDGDVDTMPWSQYRALVEALEAAVREDGDEGDPAPF